MPLRETLQTILTDYPKAKSEPLEGHALARFIRGDAETAVQEALGELGAGLLVEGSPGQGQWAAVPWISVFDPNKPKNSTHPLSGVRSRFPRALRQNRQRFY